MPVEERGMFRKMMVLDLLAREVCAALSETQSREIHSVWDSLVLLNYLRTHTYCGTHDALNCDCGAGTYVAMDKRRSSSVTRCLPKLQVASLRAEWRALLALKENKFDDTPSSDGADRMDWRAA